jgi:ABC-type antimicrobial peptide transport system permease subunit
MNPLSPLTYYRRHPRRALMLTVLLALAVMGLYLLVGLMQETYITPLHTVNRYLSKFSLVQSDRANTLDPAVTAQIRAHPDVSQVLPQNNLEIAVPNAGGVATPFRLVGLQQADVAAVLGILVPLGGMAILSDAVYAPKGLAFNPLQVSALLLVAPLPLVVIGFTLLTATRALGRMDAVTIVERGKLSLEKKRSGRARSEHAERSRAGRLPRPLASTTFYRRHMRQAMVLIGTMALMIVGTALLVFILKVSTDVMLQPPLTPLKPMSLVSQKGLPLDTTVIAQIRAHPAVELTIPPYVFSPLEISIPPMITNYPVEAYGVTAEDMAYLVELYGLELAEGHLPRPNTNEIVISEALARNRGLHVGDSVGRPVYERDLIPTEMTIVGLFATDGMWMGFASLEYVQSHELTSEFPARLLVAPVAGRKEALDARLMADVDSTETVVQTYDGRWREFQQHRRGLLGLFGVVESLIAVIAAVALAVLDYIFFSQRREEFGLLHAVGHGQGWLTWRAGRETLSVVGAAWLIGAVVCVGMMLYAQFGIYAPKGMSINSTSVAPWLFTLPIPLAVVGASAGTIAWALSRLDPVAIIERR